MMIRLMVALVALPALSWLSTASTSREAIAVPLALPWCADTSTIDARIMRTKAKLLLTVNDSTAQLVRDSSGALPLLSESQISWVTSESTCQQASAALDSAFFRVPKAAAHLEILRLPSHYLIHPPDSTTGGSHVLVVTDTTFAYRALLHW